MQVVPIKIMKRLWKECVLILKDCLKTYNVDLLLKTMIVLIYFKFDTFMKTFLRKLVFQLYSIIIIINFALVI